MVADRSFPSSCPSYLLLRNLDICSSHIAEVNTFAYSGKSVNHWSLKAVTTASVLLTNLSQMHADDQEIFPQWSSACIISGRRYIRESAYLTLLYAE